MSFEIPSDLSYTGAVAMQRRLAPKLILRGTVRAPRLVAGADLSFRRGSNRFFCAVVVLDGKTMDVVEEAFSEGISRFPYIPGLLSFREIPFILKAFAKLKRSPDVLFLDGHGLAHPRRFGLACHAGLALDVPAIGCAKSLLVGDYDEPGRERGSSSALVFLGRRVGMVLRTRTGVKPVFISQGHRIALAPAVRIALSCARGYRIPEPTRLAHRAVNRFRKRRESE